MKLRWASGIAVVALVTAGCGMDDGGSGDGGSGGEGSSGGHLVYDMYALTAHLGLGS